MLPHSLDFNRKQGFSIPLDDWLRAEPAAQLHERLRALPDFIERGEVDSLIRGLHAGRANGARLFALIMLAVAAGNRQRCPRMKPLLSVCILADTAQVCWGCCSTRS